MNEAAPKTQEKHRSLMAVAGSIIHRVAIFRNSSVEYFLNLVFSRMVRKVSRDSNHELTGDMTRISAWG